ncbi:hypothetical protein Tsubulata_045369, partial [Turnera subulata]
GYLKQSFLLTFLLLAMGATLVQSQGTRVKFYATTCPNAESIVQSTVQSRFQNQPAVAPWLLRMHFHDCFVQGCDASVLLDGTNTEKSAPVNGGLIGFDIIVGVVSCADILALAARDVVVLTKGPTWDVPLGRRDGNVSLSSTVNSNLPLVSDSMAVQKRKFAAKGLNSVQDLVTLVGGHTLGTGQNGSSGRTALDQGSPGTFDISFYNNVRNGKAVLASDKLLATDLTTKPIVDSLATGSLNFFTEFPKAMIKMSNIGVKTGTAGQIRKVCSKIN